MKLFNLRNLAVGSILGSFMLLGAASANAQNRNEEYREWREAQRRAQEEYRDYLRTRSRRDYRDWQQAQREAQREYADYQRANRRYGDRYDRDDRYDRYRDRRDGRWYRVYRDGRYYRVDNRGAEALRRAVNYGYQQGYRQGQQDARYGRDRGYYESPVYSRGAYGYQGYVDRNQYQYYFQQGFQRGYEDGYNNQFRYGYRTNSGTNILGGILNAILNLAADDN